MKKMLSHSKFCDATGAKLYSQPCQEVISWKEGSLEPGDQLNNINQAWTPSSPQKTMCVCGGVRGYVYSALKETLHKYLIVKYTL